MSETEYSGVKKYNILGVVKGIVLLLLVFGWKVYVEGQVPDVMLINRALATTGLVLMAISYFLGPLARIWGRAAKNLALRRPLGLVGFFMVLLHVALSLTLPAYEGLIFSQQMSFSFGALGFSVFLFVALVSNTSSIRMLGEKRWKTVQRTGYLGLVFSLVHVGVLRAMSLMEPYSWVGSCIVLTFAFVLVVLLARLLVLVFPRK